MSKLGQLEAAVIQMQNQLSLMSSQVEAKLAGVTESIESIRKDKIDVLTAIDIIKEGLERFFTRFAEQLEDSAESSGAGDDLFGFQSEPTDRADFATMVHDSPASTP